MAAKTAALTRRIARLRRLLSWAVLFVPRGMTELREDIRAELARKDQA